MARLKEDEDSKARQLFLEKNWLLDSCLELSKAFSKAEEGLKKGYGQEGVSQIAAILGKLLNDTLDLLGMRPGTGTGADRKEGQLTSQQILELRAKITGLQNALSEYTLGRSGTAKESEDADDSQPQPQLDEEDKKGIGLPPSGSKPGLKTDADSDADAVETEADEIESRKRRSAGMQYKQAVEDDDSPLAELAEARKKLKRRGK
jgi:hypothetical protein